MAASTCVSVARAADMAPSRLPTSRTQPLWPLASRSRALPAVVCTARQERRRGTSPPLVAVSIAAAAATAILPLDPMVPTTSASIAAVMPATVSGSASDLAAQLALSSDQAPVLGLLADEDAAVSQADRVKQLMAEYKKRKEEEAAAKAAAAAAEAAAKAPPPAPAAPPAPAPAPAPSFFFQPEPAPAPTPAPALAPKEQGALVKAESTAQGKKRTHGFLPLFISQFGLLAAYSGIVAAAFLVPDSKWKLAEEKLQEVGDKVLPLVDEALEKAQPVLEKAKTRGLELAEQAKPYVAKAIETATPIVTEAVEKAKPLLAKAGEAVLEQARPLVAKATDAAAPLVSKAEETVGPLVSKAGETVGPLVSKAGETVAQVSNALKKEEKEPTIIIDATPSKAE